MYTGFMIYRGNWMNKNLTYSEFWEISLMLFREINIVLKLKLKLAIAFHCLSPSQISTHPQEPVQAHVQSCLQAPCK